jgi:hypothetical protein
MATGRSNYLTKQAGEYIVAAELSPRGFIATTFTGNVPWYDIVAVDGLGGHALVQVKAIAANSWQLNVGQFADVVFEGHKQIIQGQLGDRRRRVRRRRAAARRHDPGGCARHLSTHGPLAGPSAPANLKPLAWLTGDQAITGLRHWWSDGRGLDQSVTPVP